MTINRKKQVAIILATCIGIFLCMLDTTVMNIALPSIQNDLDINLNNLSWALNIYTITFASLTIPLSKLADNLGRNKIYILGILSFIVGSLISSMSNNLTFLILGRGIQSIGASIVFPLSMTIGINTVPMEKRKSIISILGITQGLAAALGPSIGGTLTQFLGWRWIFIINIPLMIVSLIICLIKFNFKEKSEDNGIDYLGSVLGIIFMMSLTLTLVQGKSWGWNSKIIISLIITTIISILIFIIWEHRANSPMIPLKLFKNREFTGSSIAIILSNLFLVAVTVILPTFFTKIQNKNELTAAILITPITGMIFIFSPIAAILINKIGPRLIISTGFILMTISYILFANINMDNIYYIVISCLILGTGYGIIAGPITVLAASNFKGYLLTSSQSVAGVLRQVGISIAVAIYVTGLSSNIAVANNNSVNYIKQNVIKMDIPQSKKQIIINKATKELSSNKSNKNVTNHFSKAEKDKLIRLNYNKTMKKYNYNIPQNIKSKIYIEVQQKVNNKIKKINKQINHVISKIKNYALNEHSNAFINLYRYSIIFVALSTLSFLFFPSKNKKI
ncbi:MFS transporter [Apilactobacillus quenuiae]|uniref:MFS transporter n=1 Tax=Apilactobacillus quenuiae TaxID=2008377 RepID=UPI000D018E2F|nr:MFS transporter [Apilactobacillus quenuiae]